MPCVECHLLLVLICLMKSGISLNLGKSWVSKKRKLDNLGQDLVIKPQNKQKINRKLVAN